MYPSFFSTSKIFSLSLDTGEETIDLLRICAFLILLNKSDNGSCNDIKIFFPFYQLDLFIPGICPLDASSIRAIRDNLTLL